MDDEQSHRESNEILDKVAALENMDPLVREAIGVLAAGIVRNEEMIRKMGELQKGMHEELQLLRSRSTRRFDA